MAIKRDREYEQIREMVRENDVHFVVSKLLQQQIKARELAGMTTGKDSNVCKEYDRVIDILTNTLIELKPVEIVNP